MKLTNHVQELRRRVKIDCSEPVMTDQADKKRCDINNIMKQYLKTGVMSHVSLKVGEYMDNTQVPDLMTAFKTVNKALDAFSELPADVRKLMDNDPSKLADFVNSQENEDILVKHGVIKRKEVIKQETPSDKTPAPEIPPVK